MCYNKWVSIRIFGLQFLSSVRQLSYNTVIAPFPRRINNSISSNTSFKSPAVLYKIAKFIIVFKVEAWFFPQVYFIPFHHQKKKIRSRRFWWLSGRVSKHALNRPCSYTSKRHHSVHKRKRGGYHRNDRQSTRTSSKSPPFTYNESLFS